MSIQTDVNLTEYIKSSIIYFNTTDNVCYKIKPKGKSKCIKKYYYDSNTSFVFDKNLIILGRLVQPNPDIDSYIIEQI